MLVDPGVTVIDCNVAAVTTKLAEADLPPNAAVMLALPAATPAAKPVALTVATTVLDELQVKPANACEVPSE